jgi:predicted dehydrogenase
MPEEELKDFAVETDLSTALASKPDGVVVSNPTALHLDVAIPAANQGCHLLLEKPISHSMDRVDEFRQAVQRSGSKVLVGFQFRFHPTLRKAYELIMDGAIGRVVSFKSNWGEYLPNWHPWEDHRSSYAAREDLGGGVVLTLCHPLDYLRWMLGEVESLWAYTNPASELGSNVDAVAEIGLRYQSGVIGTVHLDYLQRPGSHTFEMTGTEGMLKWDNASAVLNLYRSSTGQWDVHLPPQGFERNWLFVEETKSFLGMIQGRNDSICNLEDGIKALELALAVQQSAREGRMWKL